ncbi:MAG: DUF4124 domain-containing protein [Gammaproteobacteria bacterium]|nr:MAG: DUF4124 domain-containing protein [Gammaproteobacteria bacterium]
MNRASPRRIPLHLAGWILAAMLLAITGQPAAEVYRWVDEQGNVIYSDTPHPGAEVIENLDPQTIESLRLKSPKKKRPVEKLAPEYELLRIASPANDSAVRANNGNITVEVEVRPPLMVELGHRLTLYLDGKPVIEGENKTTLELQNLPRGSHTLQVAITDRKGNVFKKSELIVFHLLRVHI